MAMLTRKQFLREALHASAGILGIVILTGCDDDDDGGGTGGGGGSGSGSGGSGQAPVDAPAPSGVNCLRNGTSSTIATNHGHVLVVSKDDVAAGAQKSYDIQGAADHPHTVTVTRDQFLQLAANNAIMTESSLNSSPTFGTHSHGVMVACV
jgi:hypothetical protein